MRLSPHFTLYELTRTSTNVPNKPTVEVAVNLCRLCNELLEPARKKIGRPIVVTSGYRCERLNAIVGGVKNSRHLTGQAADLGVENEERGKELFDALKELEGIDELLFEHKGKATWIHVAWSENPRHKINYNYTIK